MDQDRPKDWRELCKAAATELDPAKLMKLVSEINTALDERDQRRKTLKSSGTRFLQTEPEI
jgi:hypothetical protein